MDYTLMPSLEHITLVKIAITLWNQDDIKDLIHDVTSELHFPLFFNETNEKWPEIEDEVIEKVPQLLLPRSLKVKVLGFIKTIGLQILKWMDCHRKLLSGGYVKKGLNSLYWTPQGTVHKKKTAEVLIEDENLSLTKRYRLACIYCLEDGIKELWNKMPVSRRNSFYCEEDPRCVRQQELVVLWTYDIKGEVSRMDNVIETRLQRECSPYQYAFEYAAVGGNKAATEYFFQKLTPEEREESLVRSTGNVAKRRCEYACKRGDFPKEYYTDVLCFLLSQMNEEQVREVFKSHHYEVLRCLLDWPWQNFFMDTTYLMWDFLSGENCNHLLITIVEKVLNGYNDYNYRKLFGEFWKQSPNDHRKYITNKIYADEYTSGFLLLKLFRIKDEKNIKLILKHATLKEKEEIIFCDMGKDICLYLIRDNEWDLLEFFIQECMCISSKNKVIKFKEEFKLHIPWGSEDELGGIKNKCNKLFQLLDDYMNRYDNKNRSTEEKNDGSPTKRLCSATRE